VNSSILLPQSIASFFRARLSFLPPSVLRWEAFPNAGDDWTLEDLIHRFNSDGSILELNSFVNRFSRKTLLF